MSSSPAHAGADRPEPPSFEAMKARQKRQQGWLRDRIRPIKPRVYISVGLGFAGGLCLILQAWLLATILHGAVIEGQAITDFVREIMLVIAAVLMRAAMLGLAERVGMANAVALKTGLRRDLIARITAAGPDFVASTGSGPIITAAYDQIEALDNYIARYLPQRMLAGLIPLAIVVAVWPVNWIAALILLATGPLIIMMMALVGLGAAAASRKQMVALERLGGYFVDRLRGLDTLRLFGQAEAEMARVRMMADNFRGRTMSVLRLAFLSSAVLEFFSSIAIAILAVNIGLALLGLVNVGPLADISLFAALFILILAPDFYLPLRQLGQYYHDRATALAAAESLMEIDQRAGDFIALKDPTAETTQTNTDSAIAFNAVSLSYDGDRTALEEVSLNVTAGETIALIGPSGSGKSSLLKLLLGFVTPDSGSITINDRVLGHNLPIEDFRRQCAWVGQKTHLFRGTIAENIALARPGADRAAIEAAAESAGVTHFTRHLPDGLDTALGEQGHGVSGGEAQRIAIARAFLADRPILLLDEPTAHLDRETTESVLEGLRKLIPGRTVIAATHTPALLALADRTIALDHGRINEAADAKLLLDEALP